MQTNITDKNNVSGKLAFSVDEIAAITTLSKAFLRGEIKAGHLNAVKFGRRVLIMKNDLQSYLETGSKGRSEK